MAQTLITNDDQLKRERSRAWNFFGFEIRRKEDQSDEQNKSVKIVSPVPPSEESEGGFVTSAGGYYGQVMDVRGDAAKNDRDLLVKYRNAALQTECDAAIEDIVNEAIVNNNKDLPISLNLDQIEDEDLDEKTKEAIIDEFKEVIKLLNFRQIGTDIFRQWYIDGRIVYHKVIDVNKPEKGIQELRRINPIKIQKVREIEDEIDPKTGAKIIKQVDEYFTYSEDGFGTEQQSLSATYGYNGTGLKMTVDSIAYVTSGLLDATRRQPLSHLQKALRLVNQLRMMEDSLVIYRLARAAERRIFYIDIGDMSEKKGMEYVKKIMDSYKNKIVYDAKTGEIDQDAKQMNILEDFWLPRRNGNRGTEISTLPGGENLGSIDDIVYFQKKLYKSLNVPVNRLDNETGFNIGRTTEISRDELKFQKFVDKLRQKFGELFKDILKTQCVLKKILSMKDWENIKELILIDYVRDSFFSELKEAEILRERLTSLEAASQWKGIYYSEEYIRKKILMQSDDEIKDIRKQIYDEAIRSRTELKLPQDDAGAGDFQPEPGAAPGGPESVNIPGQSEQPGQQGGGGVPPGSSFSGEGDNPPSTGLGGPNDIPPPPGGEPGQGEADEGGETDLNSDDNEPTINPNAGDFPDFEDDENQNQNNKNRRAKRPQEKQ